jgi:hypothetical protein
VTVVQLLPWQRLTRSSFQTLGVYEVHFNEDIAVLDNMPCPCFDSTVQTCNISTLPAVDETGYDITSLAENTPLNVCGHIFAAFADQSRFWAETERLPFCVSLPLVHRLASLGRGFGPSISAHLKSPSTQ